MSIRVSIQTTVALAALALPSTGAYAQRVSKVNGTKLMSLCSAGRATDCDAYLSGVADAIGAGGRDHAAACIPDAVTGVQLREVVKKFLRDHPQDAEKPAGVLVTQAFAAAFPCK